MTSISKNVFIDKLDDIIKYNTIMNKYSNAYHSIIKLKTVDVKSSTNSKFKIGDTVRIPKYKNISAKAYTENWSEEVFVIKKFKILCCGHML